MGGGLALALATVCSSGVERHTMVIGVKEQGQQSGVKGFWGEGSGEGEIMHLGLTRA